MTKCPEITGEFWALLDAACDGELTAAQHAELEVWLDRSPQVQRLFLDHIRIRRQVRSWARGERSCRAGLERVMADVGGNAGEGTKEESNDERGAECGMTNGESPAHGTSRGLAPPIHASSFALHHFSVPSGVLLAYVAVAMVLGAATLAAWAWNPSGAHRDGRIAAGAAPAAECTRNVPLSATALADLRSPTGDSHKSGPSVSSQPPMPIVARITGMSKAFGRVAGDDIDWNSTHTGTPVRLNSTFLLASARLEITYNSGAKVLIEGPACYAVEQENGGFLQWGRLTVNVPGQGGRGGPRRGQIGNSVPSSAGRRAGGEGGASNRRSLPPAAAVFIVRTPHASVNDADGDFAVTVNEAGACLTQVFRGKVLWRSQELEEDMSEYAITVKENYQARLDILNGLPTLRMGPSNDPMVPGAAPAVAAGNMKKSTAN